MSKFVVQSHFQNSRWLDVVWWLLLTILLYFGWPAQPLASYDNHPTALLPIALLRGEGFSLHNFAEGAQAIKKWQSSSQHKPDDYDYIMVSPTGEVISDYPVFSAMLLLPWYGLFSIWKPELWQATHFSNVVQQANYSAAVGITIAMAYVWFSTARLLGYSKKLTWFVLLIGIFATPVLSVSSRFVWQHTTAMWLISLALFFYCRRSWLLTSSLAVLALLARPAVGAIVGPVLLFAITKLLVDVLNEKTEKVAQSGLINAFINILKKEGIISGAVFLFALFAVGLQVWYAHRYLDTWISFAPQYHFSRFEWWNIWQGLMGQLFSPGRGLLIYSPILMFGLWGLWLARKKYWIWLVGLFLYHLMNGAWDMWHGGWSLSYRLVMDGIPIWLLGLLVFLNHYSHTRIIRLVLTVTIGWSIMFHSVIGGLVGDCGYNQDPYNIDTVSYASRQRRLWTESPLHRCSKKYGLELVVR